MLPPQYSQYYGGQPQQGQPPVDPRLAYRQSIQRFNAFGGGGGGQYGGGLPQSQQQPSPWHGMSPPSFQYPNQMRRRARGILSGEQVQYNERHPSLQQYNEPPMDLTFGYQAPRYDWQAMQQPQAYRVGSL